MIVRRASLSGRPNRARSASDDEQAWVGPLEHLGIARQAPADLRPAIS
jgi:hypothetical protein